MVVISGWTLTLLCMFSLVYGLLHVQLGILTSAAYAGLGHTAWALGLAWIVVACCTGYGGKQWDLCKNLISEDLGSIRLKCGLLIWLNTIHSLLSV
jgi:hypothetical protein